MDAPVENPSGTGGGGGKKILVGVCIAVGVLVSGYFIYRQYASPAALPMESSSSGITSPSKKALSEPSEPATVDTVVDDIASEIVDDEAALNEETSGETATLDEEGAALNDLSGFYDENSL